MQDDMLRRLAVGLGLGSVVFGVAPVIAPRFFARLFGLSLAPDATAAVAIRSVGVRDAVIGLGLWSAASHGGRYAPWVLARALSDTGDTLACAIAISRGGGSDQRGLRALTGVAAGAAVGGFCLWLAARGKSGTPDVDRAV